VTSIATSQAQQDDGLFQLDFNDPRYLPFEGAGVISRWQLKLNNRPAQFDLTTVSDVIIHLNFTAREGGDLLAKGASDHAAALLADDALTPDDGQGLFRVVDVRRELPDEWHRLNHPGDEPQPLRIMDLATRLPFFTRSMDKTVHRIELAALVAGEAELSAVVSGVGADLTLHLAAAQRYPGLIHGISEDVDRPLADMSITFTPSAPQLEELFVIVGYTVVRTS
jgi:hypothetical protein